MNTQRIATLLIAILGIYVSLDTWAQVGNQTLNGSAGDGWFAAIAFGVVGVLAIVGKFKESFGLTKNIAVTLFSACPLAVMIVATQNIQSGLNTSHDLFSFSWAYYAVFACSIVIPIVGWTLSYFGKNSAVSST